MVAVLANTESHSLQEAYGLPTRCQPWLEWDSVFANTATIDNNFYIANATTGNFSTYGAGDLIPPGQGFWIHCTAASTLNIAETHKVASSSSTFFRTPAAQAEALNLRITSGVNNYSHESALLFDANGTDAYDAKDALYLESPIDGAPAIVTAATNGKLLSKNTLSGLQREIAIPVYVTAAEKGYHTIEVTGIDNVTHYSCVVLEDKATNRYYDMRDNASLQVFMNDEHQSARFVLHLAIDGYGLCEELPGAGSPIDHTGAQSNGNAIDVSLSFEEPETVHITVFNMMGQAVLAETTYSNVLNDRVQLQLPTGSGIYTVVARYGNRQGSHKLFIK